MDGLNKTNCGYADICKLDESNCATCKVDKESSDFHKSLICGFTWEQIQSMQNRKRNEQK